MSGDFRACVDCVHYRRTGGAKSGKTFRRICERDFPDFRLPRDIVTGFQPLLDCATARNVSAPCGPFGLFWRRRPTLSERIGDAVSRFLSRFWRF